MDLEKKYNKVYKKLVYEEGIKEVKVDDIKKGSK